MKTILHAPRQVLSKEISVWMAEDWTSAALGPVLWKLYLPTALWLPKGDQTSTVFLNKPPRNPLRERGLWLTLNYSTSALIPTGAPQ